MKINAINHQILVGLNVEVVKICMKGFVRDVLLFYDYSAGHKVISNVPHVQIIRICSTKQICEPSQPDIIVSSGRYQANGL